MKSKHTENSNQSEMELEQTNESVESEDVLDKEIEHSRDMIRMENSSGIKVILSKVWGTCLRHKVIAAATCLGILLGGIGTFLSGLNDFLSDSSDSKVTIEEVIIVNQIPTSGELEEVEDKFRKVEKNPNASVWDKVVVEAYRLKQAGKIDDSIEKWLSIANLSEGTDNNLSAGAWFAAGTLNMQKDEKHEDISVYTYDRSIFLPGYLDKPFLLSMSSMSYSVPVENPDVIDKSESVN